MSTPGSTGAVLLISPEPWEAHPVSKHHYARALAAIGRAVLFVDPPEATRRKFTLTRLAEEPRIIRVQGPRLAPGLRFWPAALRRQLERRWLRWLERQAGIPIDVVWLFENSRFYDLRFADQRLKIYHQVDLNQRFHPEIAARTANISFCTTELIRQELLPYSTRVFVLHHGHAPLYRAVDLTANQLEALSSPGLHAAYIGNLDMAYLDVELLASLIQTHPQISFHLVGGYQPTSPLHQRLAGLAHVHWWGKVPSSLIPRILERVDLQLVCYQAAHHADQASPHKFMDYLASGRTIVATYTAAYADHPELVAMGGPGTNQHYLTLFREVLVDLPTWNSSERMEARKAFAVDHSYAHQLERIQSMLHRFNLPALAVPTPD
jgi:hypothetical protein